MFWVTPFNVVSDSQSSCLSGTAPPVRLVRFSPDHFSALLRIYVFNCYKGQVYIDIQNKGTSVIAIVPTEITKLPNA